MYYYSISDSSCLFEKQDAILELKRDIRTAFNCGSKRTSG